MKRVIVIVALSAFTFAACGDGDDTSSPTPTGTHEITGRIMGPAEDARDTVDQLNDLQNSYGQ